MVPQIDFGLGLALIASSLSFVLALIAPHFLNMFWQIPEGAQILRGHLPTTIPYAISAGPVVPQEWLFEAGIAFAAEHGAYGIFVIACGLAAAVTPLLVYCAVRAFGIGDVSAGIVAFLVIGSRFAGSAERPETFAVDAFALELLILARRRNVLWLIPGVAIWANIHASVVLAPIAALAFAVGELLARRSFDSNVRRAAGTAFVVAFVTLLTPNGLHLWSYAFALAIAPNPARDHLDAWRALAFDSPGNVLAVLPGLTLLIWLGIDRHRERAGELVIAAICLALTITHARYAMFLVVGWAPAIARSLDLRAGLAAAARQRPRASILIVLPMALYALVFSLPKLSTPVEPAGPWQAAAGMISRHRLTGNTYAPYNWAAFLHWRGLPVRLLIDAHGDPYAKDVWDDHLSLEKATANWRGVLERRHIAVIISMADSPLTAALLMDSSWQRVEERDDVVAFHRRDQVSLTGRSNSAIR